jgi:4-hydroxybenzoate polyprenyltransferase
MRLLPYAQLLRLPNVFTAFADILLGALAAGTLLTRPIGSAMLVLASGCLYCAGMVWNDYFDLAVDRKERPFRPLPSGKISVTTACILGVALLTAGVAFAALAGWTTDGWSSEPAIIAGALVAAILGYDGWLKQTPVGPISMGACRFLNVLLGASLADPATLTAGHRLHLALVIGLYIIGVTWFARNEAGRSLPAHLRGAAAVMLAALLLGLALAARRKEGTVPIAFPFLLTGFGFLIGIPVLKAVTQPEPKNVQMAVKRCILGLVVLDAILATVYAGLWGLLIVLLLPPALLLGRRVYST